MRLGYSLTFRKSCLSIENEDFTDRRYRAGSPPSGSISAWAFPSTTLNFQGSGILLIMEPLKSITIPGLSFPIDFSGNNRITVSVKARSDSVKGTRQVDQGNTGGFPIQGRYVLTSKLSPFEETVISSLFKYIAFSDSLLTASVDMNLSLMRANSLITIRNNY